MINYNIPYPKLSPYFNLEDIRKVRDYEYELLKDATHEEIIKFYHEKSKPFFEKIHNS
jgi:hypothetical protein